MAKTIGFIIGAAEVAVGVVTSNPALIAAGIGTLVGSTVALLSTPGVAKPEQTETQIKTERPPRLRGYGISRRYGSWMASA